jgi:spore coat polysaccharide biosynthesis protein SpsF
MFDSDSIAIFIPARLHSSRLPQKLLGDIEGKPALWYLLNRMRMPVLPKARVVCTSLNPDDLAIAAFAEANGWESFRGDEEDVLQRYLDAAEHYGIEFMVNVDGDDLFCSEEYVDQIVERYLATDADYIQCKGLPFGGAPLGVKISALREVCARKADTSTQGWGKYFLQTGLFSVETIEVDEAVRRPEYRMTLDYPQDLEFFRTVVRMIAPSDGGASLRLAEVVQFLDAYPNVAAISKEVDAEYWERFNREHGAFQMKY